MTRHSETVGSTQGGTITELLVERALASGARAGHWTLGPDGRWQPRPWDQLHETVARLARGLVRHGLRPGDRVAFAATGSSDWDLLQWAVLSTRGVVVGVDAHAGARHLEALFALAQPNVLVVDSQASITVLPPEAIARLRFVVALRGDATPPVDGPPIVTFKALMAESVPEMPWDVAQPDDEAWIVFTSGTTGQPKGAMFRHRQVRLAIDAILNAYTDIAAGERMVSWLPLANPFQRIVNLCAVARGAETFYVEDPRSVMDHLPSIKPHLLVGVPRFYEKFHAAAMQKLSRESPLRRKVARWALRVGHSAAVQARSGGGLEAASGFAFAIADTLVLRRFRRAFGGELRYLVSGSAAMPCWLLERLHAMGLLVLEAYGLSECIVPIACNRASDYRLGTVGRSMVGVETRLSPDGELLIRSDGAFEGYLGAPDDVGVRDAEGWLATGDLAQVDDAGFIRLIGRKSETFKTSTGRRVSPQAIEAALRSIPGIEDAAVFGAGRASLVALVTLGQEFEGSLAALSAAVRGLTLPAYLRPAGLVVTRSALTIAAGELTSNLKLRRQVVAERYADALAALAEAVDAGDAPAGGKTRTLVPGKVDLVLV